MPDLDLIQERRTHKPIWNLRWLRQPCPFWKIHVRFRGRIPLKSTLSLTKCRCDPPTFAKADALALSACAVRSQNSEWDMRMSRTFRKLFPPSLPLLFARPQICHISGTRRHSRSYQFTFISLPLYFGLRMTTDMTQTSTITVGSFVSTMQKRMKPSPPFSALCLFENTFCWNQRQFLSPAFWSTQMFHSSSYVWAFQYVPHLNSVRQTELFPEPSP